MVEWYETCKHLNYSPFLYTDNNGYYRNENLDPDNNFYNILNVCSEYYTQDQMNLRFEKYCHNVNMNSNVFIIIHFNCRSLCAHFDKLMIFFNYVKNKI